MPTGRDWAAEVEVLIGRLAAAVGLPMDALVGATDEQIVAIARLQGFTHLPAPYVAFLRLIGGAVTDPYLFVGETIVAPELICDGGPSWRAERMMPEGPGFFGLRPVFLDREGWDFCYFVENRDDSPIAQISEGATGEGSIVASDFVAWLETCAQLVEHNARNRPPTDPRLEAVLPADGSTWEGAEPLAEVRFELMQEHAPDAVGVDWETFATQSAVLFDRFGPEVAASERGYQDRRVQAAARARQATDDAVARRTDSGEREALGTSEDIIRAALEELCFDDGAGPDAMAEAAAVAALDCARRNRDVWETTYRIWTAAGRASPTA